MAHPIENSLGNSTSQSETDILAKSPNERFHSNNIAYAALHHPDRDCVTRSSSPAPIYPMKISQRYLQGLLQPLWPSISLSGPTSASWGSVLASGAFASHTLALFGSAQLLVASVWPLVGFASTSSGFCVNPLGTNFASLLCIHCPSTATQITHSISSANPAPENRILDLSLCVLQLTLNPPLILFSLVHQRLRLNL